jgi:hypothetical protein
MRGTQTACEARPDLQSKSQEYVFDTGGCSTTVGFLSMVFRGVKRHISVIRKATNYPELFF